MIPETFWSYLAGFFDGEGCLATQFAGRYASFYWVLYQSGDSGKQLLEEIRDVFFASGLQGSIRVRLEKTKANNLIKKPENPRQYWSLKITRSDSVFFILKKLMPYLRIKKAKAQDIVRFCKIYPRATPGQLLRSHTKCWKGHPYSPENTLMNTRANGRQFRQCRICRGIALQKRRDRRAAA